MSVIRLDGVSKRFEGEQAVNEVDLTVRDGELLALVGPSGCGKTTLLRLIAGLESPDSGEVFVGGERMTDSRAREREIALMFQDYALFPHLTVAENVGFNREMRGSGDVEARVEEAAEMLDIADLLDRDIETLSGGQKQRVALGRALADEPNAFLFDEPLANLDASLRDRTRSELARLQAELEITTVHVTHDQREALTMGDRVAVMHEGELQQVGTPQEIYRRPANLFVARFVGSPTMNCLAGSIRDGAIEVGTTGAGPRIDADVAKAAEGDAAEASEGSVVVGVRPEQMAIEFDETDSSWSATVDYVGFEGADAFVHLEADGLGEVVARVRAERAPAEGDSVLVTFDPAAIHLFDAETETRIPAVGERFEQDSTGVRPSNPDRSTSLD